jgi:hypothetical protein
MGLILAGLSSVAILYGRTQPVSPELEPYGFDIRQGRFAFMGIVPGVTPAVDGKAILHKQATRVDVFNDFSATFTISLPAGLVDAQYLEFRERIDWLHLEVLGGRFFSAGTLVSILREPCAVQRSVYAGRYSVVLVYPTMRFKLQPSDKGVSPWDRVVEVELANNTPICPPVTPWVPWIGFASLERYKALGWSE